MDMFKPTSCGMPSKFVDWRPMQSSALFALLDPDGKRFKAQAHPTGAGKSVIYMAAAKSSRGRALILTSTKALQDQLMRDFESIGLVEIRGQTNYACKLAPSLPCSEGKCHYGKECRYKTGGCPYYDQLRKASNASMVVTNYSYWMTMVKASAMTENPLGEFGTMILDEAHDAPTHLMDFLTIGVDGKMFRDIIHENIPDHGQNLDRWKKWANVCHSAVTRMLGGAVKNYSGVGVADLRTMSRLRELSRAFDELFTQTDRDWYFCLDAYGLRAGAIRPSFDKAEKHLFNGIQNVILMSATIRPRTMEMLGILSEHYLFDDFPSMFPRERCPIHWIKTLRMNKNTSERDMLSTWIPHIDMIIGRRLDRKGVVHTHSYERMYLFTKNSKHRDIMYSNNKWNTQTIVEEFRKAEPPAVIASPTLSTGWDFPMKDCEFQVIGKLPFPNISDGLLAHRVKESPGLIDYMTMQTLVQTTGRGMRSAEDQCETFIVDDSIQWYMDRNRGLAPLWFLESFDGVGKRVIPAPPPKL